MPKLIRIHPGYNAFYYSYYMWGLINRFGWNNIEFTRQGFPDLHHHCLCITCDIDQESKKIYISAGDGTGLNKNGLEWCDFCGKVNVDPNDSDGQYQFKIMPIGPSFGIRYLAFPQFLMQSLFTFSIARKEINNPREHFANYYRQWRYRLPLEAYKPGQSSTDYVFSAHSLWSKEHKINEWRSMFMEVCTSIPGIEFEGGFSKKRYKIIPGYEEFTIDKRYSHREYIQKIKNSMVVFNTPAVQDCLGWKLGEYLALGKAIITTPITRELPAPLVDGEHVHYLKNPSKKTIHEAIERISADKSYRTKLESGSHRYYKEHLEPNRVISYLIDAVKQ